MAIHWNASKHAKISFVKSGFRLLGYFLLPVSLPTAVSVLVVSEIIGIVEEFGL